MPTKKELKKYELADTDYCGDKRPPRKTFCQLPKGHVGSHRAVVFWEGES